MPVAFQILCDFFPFAPEKFASGLFLHSLLEVQSGLSWSHGYCCFLSAAFLVLHDFSRMRQPNLLPTIFLFLPSLYCFHAPFLFRFLFYGSIKGRALKTFSWKRKESWALHDTHPNAFGTNHHGFYVDLNSLLCCKVHYAMAHDCSLRQLYHC